VQTEPALHHTVPTPRTAALVMATLFAVGLSPHPASAGFLDFLFGPSQPRPAQQGDGLSDPFGGNAPPTPPAAVGHAGSGYCVRSCDGRYFPVQAHGGASPAQMCQAFCPASPTKVYFGGAIDNATTATGERYADSENAFAFRKALKADCTCNGRDPTGLAPVDLSLDTTLRPGDIIATSNGLVAYSGSQVGDAQTAEFTPVANYPGLTPAVRAKLGEMKVSPVGADVSQAAPATPPTPSTPARGTTVPKSPTPQGRRAALD